MDINTLAENLTELLTNTVNMTDVFYDIFLNPTPMDVTLQQYDSTNTLVTVTIPNRAKDRKIALEGSGSPNGSATAPVGTAYVDTSANKVYFKVTGSGNTGWVQIVDVNYMDAAIEAAIEAGGFITLQDLIDYLTDNSYVKVADLEPIYTELASKADDSTVVHNTGNETIAGIKTFTSSVIVGGGSMGVGIAGPNIYVTSGSANVTVSAANGHLTTDGYQVLDSRIDVNNSKALETGATSSNEAVYSDIYKYAHSTFDLSKFTVVGTPTITDDGLAYGFSNGNVVRMPVSFDKPFRLNFAFKTSSSFTSTQYLLLGSNHGIQVYIVDSAKLQIKLGSTSWAADILYYNPATNTLLPSTDYTFSIEFTGTKYNIYVNNVLEQTANSSSLIATETSLSIGAYSSQSFLGVVDLKKCSFYVDGIPVFNGNKTGIDTIKPDNYTVVGTPTISADGITSNFSYSNGDYVKTASLNISSATDFELLTPYFKLGNFTSGNSQVLNWNAYAGTRINIWQPSSSQNTVKMVIAQDSTIVVTEKSFTIDLTKWYQVKAVYKNQAWNTYYKEVETNNWVQIHTNVSDNIGVTIVGERALGYDSNNNYLQNGQLDLNGMEIYVNGDLKYQPCLKIPYSESKTGSKVADVAYRPRVQSMYEQYGKAPYYTIDEANANFTLPMGEIYGMLTNRINKAPAIKSWGASIIGSLTNNNGVLSGFSPSNYAVPNLTFYPGSSTWEMNFKVTTSSSLSNEQEVISDGYNALELEIVNSRWALEINGDTTATIGTHAVLPSTTYYLRLKYTGSAYTLEYSTDGSNYTLDVTYSSSTPYHGDGYLSFGYDVNIGGNQWLGSIDLNGCNISVGSNLWWQGSDANVSSNEYASSSKPAVVIESYIKGTSWYRVWSDGWCEQGGQVAVGSVTGTSGERLIDIGLIKSYVDSNYSTSTNIQSGTLYSNIYMDAVSFIYSKQKDSFRLGISPVANSTFYIDGVCWETKGYIS